MAIFTLTINARTAAFGDNASQERAAVAQLLQQAAQKIGSHSPPFVGQNVPEPGNLNPANCSYAFGPGSLNNPVNPNTGTTAGGTAVTVKGSGFTGINSVLFGGAAATSVAVVDDGTITCVTPAHAAGAVDVVVGGRFTFPNAFTFA